MHPILNLIITTFITLVSLTTNPQLALAHLQQPNHNGIRGKNETKDYESLLAIKDEISGDPHSVLSSWNDSLHFCEWKGVTCGRKHQRRVVSLRLDSSNLAGKLSPFIGNMSFLRVLYLSNNSFRGPIPPQISRLRRLQALVLQVNSFEGEIPANLSRCTHLSILSLSHNKLVGRVPIELASLPKLSVLSLTQNSLTGRLQDIGIGNMTTSLRRLYLNENRFQGSIPNDIGRLEGLTILTLGFNMISGTIPASLFNLSNLETLGLENTQIHGHLPQDLGLRLPQLQYLSMAETSLTGNVPTSLSNLSNLEVLVISDNSFMGGFYLNGNNLPYLSFLNIDSAFSKGQGPTDLGFLDTLTNCTNLNVLSIGGNSFAGAFPRSILNLSTELQALSIGANQIHGRLPLGLGRYVKLYALDFSENHFTGSIPPDVGNLESIGRLDFSHNSFSGEVPNSMGNLTKLGRVWMEYNNLEGSLPRSLGKCQNLQELSLFHNKLGGVLPIEMFSISSLLALLISQNNFKGSLPVEISSLRNLIGLDVSNNGFSSEIPSTLGACTSLTYMNLSRNSFVGSIPESLKSLKSIQQLDLSSNNLSGQIPSYLSTWPNLLSLNLSFNNLEGEVPFNGVFANTSALSVVGNSRLCGGAAQLNLPKCPPKKESKKGRLSLPLILIITFSCVLVIILLLALCFHLVCSSKKRKDGSSETPSIRPFLEVSYQMLSRATNGFSSSNLIGTGGFGNVYKGILHQDDDDAELEVAVKVMKLQNERASKGFMAECRALRNIRHRNLVKVITACSSLDNQGNTFKALVYEFMSKGSLESWLHSSPETGEEGGLSLFQRLSIIIDVAFALEYLHVECDSPIVHCDLKPSNILLDDEMTAHVSDFGLAKFLSREVSASIQTSSNQVRGTIGYTAPEYGTGSQVSPEGDTYSFGIVVLEVMTSKKPTDPMFNDGLNLHDFAKAALPSGVMDVVDPRMCGDADVLRARNTAEIKKMECIKSLIVIGVKCSLELPQERMSIKDVVNELNSVRKNLLSSRV